MRLGIAIGIAVGALLDEEARVTVSEAADSLSATVTSTNSGDVAVAEGADAAAGTSTNQAPWLLTGIAAWFEADTGVSLSGSNFTAWADTLSGSGLSLSPGSAAPTFVSNAYNGAPTARLAVASLQSMTLASKNLWGTGPYSIVAVIKPTALALNCGVGGSWTASGGAGFYFNGSSRSALHAGSANHQDGAAGTALQQVSITRAAASAPLMWVDGSSQALGSSGTTTLVDPGGTAKLTVGEGNGNGTTFDGDIPAIGFYTASLSSSDRAIAELYLKTKYGTP